MTRCSFRVKSATLTAPRSLPVFPYEQTSAASVGMSQRVPDPAIRDPPSISSAVRIARTTPAFRKVNRGRELHGSIVIVAAL